MDWDNLSNDELAEIFREAFAQVEARIAASEHPQRQQLTHLTASAHRFMNRVGNLTVASGDIQPFSGGIPKPE